MINSVILIGRLGHNPETRHLSSGSSVCNFSLATDEKWTDQAGVKQSKTEWHNCIAFGKLAEICDQYLAKGKLVYVSGKIQTREWDDKQGNKRHTTEIIVNEMKMLDRADKQTDQGSNNNSTNGISNRSQNEAGLNQDSKIDISDDDIPF